MKNQSRDPLENLFQSQFDGFEKQAPMEPLKGALSRLSAQKMTMNLLMIMILILSLLGGLVVFSDEIFEGSSPILPSNIIANDKAVIKNSTSFKKEEKRSESLQLTEKHSKELKEAHRNTNSMKSSLSEMESNRIQYTSLSNSTKNEFVQTTNSTVELNEYSNLNSLKSKGIPLILVRPINPSMSRVVADQKEQTVVRIIREKTRSSFHTQVLPMLLYNIVSPNKNDELLIQNFETHDALSTQRLGLRASLNYEYVLTKKIRITSGISLMYKKLSFSYHAVNYQIDSTIKTMQIPGVGFEITTQSTDTISYANSISITSKNIGLFGGLIYQFNKRHQVGLNFELQKHLDDVAANSEQQLGIVDRSFIYIHYLYELPLNEKLIFNIQPTLSYSFDKVNFDNPITVKPYGIGIGVGLKYRLFKNRKIKQ